MQFAVDAGAAKDANIKVTVLLHQLQNSVPGTPDQDIQIKNDIASSFKTHIGLLEGNLKNAFSTTGKFVYPGNGTFDFSNPVVGNTGEILAEILYKP